MLAGKTPTAIAEVLGKRLKRARLNINMTQIEVADRAGITRKVVMQAEKGRVQLQSLIAILQVLDLTDSIDNLLPQPMISPIQLAKLQGKQRQRATGVEPTWQAGPTAW